MSQRVAKLYKSAKLSVPQLEMVGKLRQQSMPNSWDHELDGVFKSHLAVRRGHRVDVVIGSFWATNLS
jgi:hypothetical protein